MKKKIATLMVAILVLFPKTSRADLDVLSIVQDALKTFQEKANTIVQGYIGIQVNLQELALNRNMLSALRDSVKEQLMEKANTFIADVKNAAMDGAKEFLNKQLSSVTLPGLNTSISFGPYTSPVLKQKVAKSYVKRKNQKSDVIVIQKQDDRNNREIVENIAIIYANALVKRKELIDEAMGNEEDDKCADNPDVSTLQSCYGQTARKANHRWLEILQLEAAYRQALAKVYMTNGRVDDISEIIGKEESEVETDGLEDIGAEVIGQRQSVDVLALRDQWNTGLDAMKNGDYAGALNAAAAAYGVGAVEGNQDVVNIVNTAASGAGNAYNAAQSGNWGGVVGSVGGAVGDSLGGDAGNIINTASSGADSAINSAQSGNWSGVVGSVGGAVGDSIGGADGNDISAWGGIISSGMDIGNNTNSWEDLISNIAENGQLSESLDRLNKQREELERQRQEAERQQNAELVAKIQEQMRQLEEQMKQQLKEEKQKECQECRAKNPNSGCISACSSL